MAINDKFGFVSTINAIDNSMRPVIDTVEQQEIRLKHIERVVEDNGRKARRKGWLKSNRGKR